MPRIFKRHSLMMLMMSGERIISLIHRNYKTKSVTLILSFSKSFASTCAQSLCGEEKQYTEIVYFLIWACVTIARIRFSSHVPPRNISRIHDFARERSFEHCYEWKRWKLGNEVSVNSECIFPQRYRFQLCRTTDPYHVYVAALF